MNIEERGEKVQVFLDGHDKRDISVTVVENDMSVVVEIVDHIVVLGSGKKVGEGTSETSENG